MVPGCVNSATKASSTHQIWRNIYRSTQVSAKRGGWIHVESTDLALKRAHIIAFLDVWILSPGPKWNLGHRSFFSLGKYVNEFIQIISFFEQSSFKLRCETVIGIILCYSHQACCLLYYLCEITSNNGIHIYLSGCNCGFGFEEKISIGKSMDLTKKSMNQWICIYPIHSL